MKFTRTVPFLMGALLAVTTASADTIYSNAQTPRGYRMQAGTLEVADEINFDGGARYLTGFQLEYWGVFSSPVQARVRLYENNGASVNGYASPSTKLFDTDWFTINYVSNSDPLLDGRSTLIFTPGQDNIPVGLFLPNKVTMSIQFQGMTGTDSVGFDSYGPATIGSSAADYWVFENGAWDLRLDNNGAIDLGLIVQAVPEPTSLALLLGAGFMAFAVRRK